MINKKGNIIVLSSASGTGKTTISNSILKIDKQIVRSVSLTTREIRSKEKQGLDYFFVSKDIFVHEIKNNTLLEYASIFSNYYGTKKEYIYHILNKGIDVFCCIDFQGLLQIQKNVDGYNIISIFLLPPTMNELKTRLCNRNSESSDNQQLRIINAKKEFKNSIYYDYVLINDELHSTIQNVHTIIKIHRNNMKNYDLNAYIDFLIK